MLYREGEARWASLVQSGVVPESFLEIDAQREHLCGNQLVRRVPKSFLGDDVAALAPSSGEEPASPRRRAGVASMAWGC